MIPKTKLEKIGRVTIYYISYGWITGFSFFDKKEKLLWEIGNVGTG